MLEGILRVIFKLVPERMLDKISWFNHVHLKFVASHWNLQHAENICFISLQIYLLQKPSSCSSSYSVFFYGFLLLSDWTSESISNYCAEPQAFSRVFIKKWNVLFLPKMEDETIKISWRFSQITRVDAVKMLAEGYSRNYLKIYFFQTFCSPNTYLKV